MLKVIDSTQYHLWTDALHGRELARQAKNAWDRGVYVRWAIMSAWSAFETAAGDALAAARLGTDFQRKFNRALTRMGIPSVDWDQGFWLGVSQVYGLRKEFTHVQPTISQGRLQTPLSDAETAIAVLRDAIREVCRLVNHPAPIWVDDDSDRGWDVGRRGVHMTAIKDGADPEGPDTIRIAYVQNGVEHFSDILPPGSDHSPALDRLMNALTIYAPASLFRAYRGKVLIEERSLPVRGA